MIFRKDLAEKVMAGRKTVTRRLVSENPNSPWWIERCRYPEGKEFTVNPGRGKLNIGRARVVSCERVVLGHPSEAEARREGFATAAEFEEGFAGINGNYDPEASVWRVELEAVR